MAAAYRKDFGQPNQNVQVQFDPENGFYKVYDVKTVVQDFTEEELEAQREELRLAREDAQKAREEGRDVPEIPETDKLYFNPKLHVMLAESKKIKEDAEIGQEIRQMLDVPTEFGRMAAQTAKQVITQKLREAERSTIFDEYKDKQGTIVMGVVQRREGRNWLVDIGRTTAILPPEEQIRTERYASGQRVKVFLVKVEMGPRGPLIVVSRAHPDIVRQLFATEIPEISNGIIEIMGLAREAGSRTKVSVRALDENIDPIGSCVGQRGSRVRIISELGGEKVDIIEYVEDLKSYIAHALSPAKVSSIELNEEGKIAQVKVAEDQLSLAIGRSGQNVRLASKLTGWNINIEGSGLPTENAASTDVTADKPAAETTETPTAEETPKA